MMILKKLLALKQFFQTIELSFKVWNSPSSITAINYVDGAVASVHP